MPEERQTKKEKRSKTLEQKAEALFEELDKCAEISYTDTPFMGDRAYATLNRQKALILILEALR